MIDLLFGQILLKRLTLCPHLSETTLKFLHPAG